MARRLSLLAAVGTLCSAAALLVPSAPGAGTVEHAPVVPRLAHVVVVVFENHEVSAVAAGFDAPHFVAYARGYATLGDYAAVTHPSLPNYLALVSGSTQGIATDCSDCTAAGPSIGTELSAAGRSWGGYAEGYPSSPRFTKRHMPFLYFPDGASHVHPLSALLPRRLPAFALVAPDLCDDGHDCSLTTADGFLQRFLPPLLLIRNTAVFVVFDEGTSDTRGGGRVFAFVAGSAVRRHVTITRPVDHYTVLRTVEDALGVAPLGTSADRAPITGIWK